MVPRLLDSADRVRNLANNRNDHMLNLPCVPGIPFIRSPHICYCVVRMFHQFLLARNCSVLCASKKVSMKRVTIEGLFKPFLCWEFSHICELVPLGAAVASLEEDLLSLILALLMVMVDDVSLLKSSLLATSFKKRSGLRDPVLLANETACEYPYISLTKLCSCLVRSFILMHSGMMQKLK